MFNVIVVDDEPTAIDYIVTIIETKCPKFRVINTAENAKDGLDKIKKYKPDLVITDIKMSMMSGIELAKYIKNNMPEIHTIIVSGYQDIEYTKGAIQAQALDYILKPINPSSFKKSLDNIVQKLCSTRSNERNKLIRNISRGIIPKQEEIKRYFPDKEYYAALIRRNGLPRRFSNRSNIEIFSGQEEMIYLYGRDEEEALYILNKEIVHPNDILSVVKNIVKKEENHLGYITAIYEPKCFTTEKLYDTIINLYKILDAKISIGHNQIITTDDECKLWCTNSKTDKLIFKEIDYIIQEQRWNIFKKRLTNLINIWEEEKYPQLFVERYVKQVFYSIQVHHDIIFNYEYEFMLEDAFFHSTSMEELRVNLLEIFYSLMKDKISQSSNCQIDTWALFQSVQDYLQRNLSEDITLKSICTEFGVSQTYLSKLFRKYENETFNNYLTNIRIERAKELMREDNSFLIKDVAAMVGYKDQFYFSRVFSSVTGIPPSVYVENINV